MRWILSLALVAAMTATATAQGPEGPALSFDGVDDWVDMGAGPSGNAPFTIELWVKPTLASTQMQFIAGPYGDRSGCYMGAGFLLRAGTETTPGKLAFVVGLAGCGNDDVIEGPVPTLGRWYHIAGSYDGSTMRFYVDGNLQGELTNIDYSVYPHFVAGCGYSERIAGPEFFFGGELDDVRMWDHVRSATEIEDGRQNGIEGDEAGLTGYWNFDDGSGQAAAEGVAGVLNGRLGDSTAEEDSDPTWITPSVASDPVPTIEESIEALLQQVQALDIHSRRKAALSVRLRIALRLLRDDRVSNDRAVLPLLHSFTRSLSMRCGWRLLEADTGELIASARAIMDRLCDSDDSARRKRCKSRARRR